MKTLAAFLTSFAALPVLAGGPVLVTHVKGVINSGTAQYLGRAISLASEKSSPLLVIVLDTPGGVLQSTREIVQKMNASRVPVGVYVSPSGASATSAGTIVAMSAHYAGMAPGTNIGAAHPVGGQGEDIKGTMNEKAVNDTVAFLKAQAVQHGRNADWAEKAIRKSESLPADEAVKNGAVDFLASDLEAFILKVVEHGEKKGAKVEAAGIRFEEVRPTVGERLLSFLGDPNISYLLMVLGGLGIYVEITSPGVVLPGVLGAIALILSFISFSTLPVNYGAVALLTLGLVLFVLEAFVASYGALTLGGIVSIVLGATFLLDPSTGDLSLSLTLVVPTVLAMGLVTAFIGYSVLRSRRQARYGGLDTFAGLSAKVESIDDSGHSGKCIFKGELWDFELATSSNAEKTSVRVGDSVRVTGRTGFRLEVSKG
ncbi:MAG: nodulation protein NfeD [Deltaproteobacteria bacterium]|nr:nodulation protein NfeD [Deltaproteobacteria bacterium]